jgi:hypothetical protein
VTTAKWHLLNPQNKRSLVAALQRLRTTLLETARKDKATKRRRKTTSKRVQFKSKELEDYFYKMPPEMQKFIRGR